MELFKEETRDRYVRTENFPKAIVETVIELMERTARTKRLDDSINELDIKTKDDWIEPKS